MKMVERSPGRRSGSGIASKVLGLFFRNGCIYSNLSKSAIGLASTFSLSQFNAMNYHPKTQDTRV